MTDVVAVSTGSVGSNPYADVAEHLPIRRVPRIGRVYGDVHPTDARAVEIFLTPPHYNFIPNPSCRVDDTGWVADGPTVRLDVESWSGQGLTLTGEGVLHYEDAGGLVFVGPTDAGKRPTGAIRTTDWWEPTRAGNEYTFSVFAKGTDAMIQLSMYGYEPEDLDAGVVTPTAEPKAQVHSGFFQLNDEEWERFFIKTTSRLEANNPDADTFGGCWWIKVEVEVVRDYGANPNDPEVLLSSFMLDASEGTLCDYFDGGMDEEAVRDDFLWLGAPNESISVYYYDRLVRTHWLWRNLYTVVPANRPIHIYFHDRAHPWHPDSPPLQQVTALTRRGDFDRRTTHYNI